MPTSPISNGADRRQSPRIRYGGLANIVSLPSDGLAVRGRVLNLSLGGCSIETDEPLAAGTRTEILLRVHFASFRVVGEVRALRDTHVLGIQFLLLSSCGKDMLEELIRELARQRARAIAKGSRRHPDSEVFPQIRLALLNESRLIAGSLVTLEKAERKVEPRERPALDAVCGATTNRIVFNSEELDVFI